MGQEWTFVLKLTFSVMTELFVILISASTPSTGFFLQER